MKRSKNGKPGTLGKSDYFDKLEPLQLELNDLARWLVHTGERLMVVIEGRDSAGKGGVISAIADTLNLRQCRTVALAKPSEREQSSGTFSATCRIFLQLAKLCCLTAVGTTARV